MGLKIKKHANGARARKFVKAHFTNLEKQKIFC